MLSCLEGKITSKTVDQLERCRIGARTGWVKSGDLTSLKTRGFLSATYGLRHRRGRGYGCSMLWDCSGILRYDVSSRHYQGDWQNQHRETQRLSQSVLGVIGVTNRDRLQN